MAKSIGDRRREPKVGPRIVRAWFDTVINPLLSALKLGKEYLEKRNWSWQFSPERLESIRPIEHMLNTDNLEQFLDFYPDIKKLIDEYEVRRNKLFTSCKELHQKIKENGRLQEIYQRAITPESLLELEARGLSDIFGAYPPEKHFDVLAQYIVNNTDYLPFYYTTSKLWAKYKDDLLALLDSPGTRAYNRKVVKAGESLLEAVEELISSLRTHRVKLSLEHDVPYVSPTNITSG